MPPRCRLGFREETQNYAEKLSNLPFNLVCLPHCLCDYKLKSKISRENIIIMIVFISLKLTACHLFVFKRSLIVVKI